MNRKVLVILGLSLSFSAMLIGSQEAEAAQTMHRMYNPNSGEHFYTANGVEKDILVNAGWKYEGTGWTAPDSGADVYRMYNANAGDHHYTMNGAERDMLVKLGWKYEGVGWKTDLYNGVALHRLYNPNAIAGSHHYTTNAGERDSLATIGWKKEGIGWYGMNPKQKFSLKVIHKDSSGKTLNQETVSVSRDNNYTAKAKLFSGYALKGSSSQTVKADSDNKTITFTYTKNATPAPQPVPKYNVTVVHIGLDGTLLETEKDVSVDKGMQHTAKAKNFDGYTLSGNNSQTITVNSNQTITFKYTKNPVAGVDKSALYELVELMYQRDGSDFIRFTDESVRNFINALNDAEEVLKNQDATQVEVDNAEKTLQNADDSLVEKTTVPGVNKYDLQSTIVEIEAKWLKAEDYTPDSWNVLQNALSKAKTLDQYATSYTQKDVDNATAALKSAFENLVAK